MVLLTNSPHQRDEQSSKRVPVGKRPGRLNGKVTPPPCCLNTGGNLNLGRKKFNWVSCRRNSGTLLSDLIEFVEEEKTSFGGSVSGFPVRARSGLTQQSSKWSNTTQHNTAEEKHCLDLVQTVNNCLVQTTIVQSLPSFSLNPSSSLFSRARSTKLKLAEIVVLI